jgi:hypothetical protein
MSASQTNLSQLQYSDHSSGATKHKSKLSFSGFGTPKTGSPFGTPNLSRTSLHAGTGPAGQGGEGEYRMSQLGSEVILDSREGDMVGDDRAQGKGWYGKAF